MGPGGSSAPQKRPIAVGAHLCMALRAPPRRNRRIRARAARWRNPSQRCAPVRGPTQVARDASAPGGPATPSGGLVRRCAHPFAALEHLRDDDVSQGDVASPPRGLSHCLRIHARPCVLLRGVPSPFPLYGPAGARASHPCARVRGLAQAGRRVRGRTARWRWSCAPVRGRARPFAPWATPGAELADPAYPVDLPRMDAPQPRPKFASMRSASPGLRTGTKVLGEMPPICAGHCSDRAIAPTAPERMPVKTRLRRSQPSRDSGPTARMEWLHDSADMLAGIGAIKGIDRRTRRSIR